ncbi:lanthionine synthetase LanC family protein [Haladaptatus sp. CMAA 1911]|uniref:lanthionine synthetase LanC family protein n=1 Tax=unclassified Haladaptatus TaxID=2622732 RepID=UPI003754A3BC
MLGNFGRIESLLFASINVDSDVGFARKYASQCIARRETNLRFHLPGHTESFVNPTFFNGLSGISYTLLRLRHPSAFPSVLLLD